MLRTEPGNDAFVLSLIDASRLETFAISADSPSATCIAFTESQADAPSALLNNEEGILTLVPDRRTLLFNGEECTERCELSALSDGTVLTLRSEFNQSVALLTVRRATAGSATYAKVSFSADARLAIGRGQQNALIYDSPLVSQQHAVLTYQNAAFSLTDLGSANGTFVNGRRFAANQSAALHAGDVVRIMDLSFTVGLRFIVLNKPEGVTLKSAPQWRSVDHADIVQAASDPATEIPDTKPFYPAPRLMHSIHQRTFHVDAPPSPPKKENTPAILQLGPSFLMAIGSVFMASTAITRFSQGSDMLATLPTLAMAVAMVGGTIIWPLISKRYNRKHDEREERRRQSKYSDYLNGITADVLRERDQQTKILEDNRAELNTIVARAVALSPQLMDRSSRHPDFLELRVGRGQQKTDAKIEVPSHGFTLDDDVLLEQAITLADKPTIMNVPLAVNLAGSPTIGIVGDRQVVWDFVRGLLVQVAGLYGYDDVKISALVSKAEESQWRFLKAIPHTRTNDGRRRFLADDAQNLLAVDAMLGRELDRRLQDKQATVTSLIPFHVVLCADADLAKSSTAVSRLTELPSNRGFCLLFMGEELADLPNECSRVIELSSDSDARVEPRTGNLGTVGVGAGSSQMFDRDDVSGTAELFQPDIMCSAAAAQSFALALSRARLDVGGEEGAMPESLGFLEMFKVGNALQLNIGERWDKNDASRTLATPLGLDAKGQYVMLNLHEDAHGPHGLIAGTTGSGKSETIIAYVLSLAVNYSPDEVSFVLIDYKGGGLAGAFDNQRYRLPHLAGTITNLDGSAINRSLVSIKSELKRRQEAFNKARDLTGEATMDIYKYISYYRQGVLKEPIPHLFVIADEFAELKQQQPEFMEELISAARIGRSLGLHLILATQKPTGVVNDQIWSNSRFKISLKVADAADSREMIRRTDAAELTRPGQFYLLVGYNEYFTGGQSAYTGVKYVEREAYEPQVDESVELVDITGDAVAKMKPATASLGGNISELNAVLGKLGETERALGRKAQPLWLDPLPPIIDLQDLHERYDRQWPDEQGLRLVVGEFDDPENQRKELLVEDLEESGNIIVYGNANTDVEGLVAVMLAEAMQRMDPSMLHVYAMDFGGGTFSAFANDPHVGDVVMSDDSERISNLFRFIQHEQERRRELFAQYGGSLNTYNAQTERPEAHIVVALLNVSSFYELYPKLDEELNRVTRDGSRYGIHFIITAAGAMQPKTRLRANVGRNIVTAFRDQSDYISVLDGLHGMMPPNGARRGLVRTGKGLYEFQGASLVSDAAGEAEAIRHQAKAARDAWLGPVAAPIPTLPKRVLPAMFQTAKLGREAIPVGFASAEVAPAYFNGLRTPFMLTLSNDEEKLNAFFAGLCATLTHNSNDRVVVLDTEQRVRAGDVRSASEQVMRAVEEIQRGEVDIVLIPSMLTLLSGLSAEASKALTDLLTTESIKKTTTIVLGSEAWRVRSLYDPWFKTVSAYKDGVWLGTGFREQGIINTYGLGSADVAELTLGDGVLAMRGSAVVVRPLVDKAE